MEIITSAPRLRVLRRRSASRAISIGRIIVSPTIPIVIVVTIVEVRLVLVVAILVSKRLIVLVVMALFIGPVIATTHSTVVASRLEPFPMVVISLIVSLMEVLPSIVRVLVGLFVVVTLLVVVGVVVVSEAATMVIRI